MKKLTVLAVAVMMVLGVAGAASAITFVDVEDFTNCWGSPKELRGDDEFSWTHATPADFEVPFDVINSATIEIFAKEVSGNNDEVVVEGTLVGTLNNEKWVWDWWPLFGHYEGAEFDIAALLDPWANGDVLNVTLDYNESGRNNKLYLYSSKFTLVYDNGTAPVTDPVPEPGTVFLIGSGLLGLVALKRKYRS